MSCLLFCHIQYAVEAHNPYFPQRRDGSKRLSFSSLQKMTTTLRMLAYGIIIDFIDKYLKIGEATVIESLERFVQVVISVFSEEY
jgi:hypothetical protein